MIVERSRACLQIYRLTGYCHLVKAISSAVFSSFAYLISSAADNNLDNNHVKHMNAALSMCMPMPAVALGRRIILSSLIVDELILCNSAVCKILRPYVVTSFLHAVKCGTANAKRL